MRRIWIVLLTVMCSACVGTSGTEVLALAGARPQGTIAYSTYVRASNTRLARRLAVTRVEHTDVGGLTKAAVTLRSTISDTQPLQYRWAWFDSHGIEVNSSAQAWQPLLMYGKHEATVQGLAPNPSAKSFKLHLREQE